LPARALNDGTDSVAIAFAPPGPYPVGTTRVKATAANACGSSSSAEFSVTVTTEVCGARFYDANGNGNNDDQRAIGGWSATLTGTDAHGPVGPLTMRTSADGRYCFSGLLPGSYTVASELSPGTTTSTLTSFTFPKLGSEGACPGTADFGEVCLGKGGGQPIAYWISGAGQRTLNDGGTSIPEMEEQGAL